MTTTIPNELTTARATLLAQHHFLASLLFELVKGTSYDPEIPTAATDGETIWVGDWFCQLTAPERVFVLAHEVLHVMFDHMGRTKLYRDRGFGPDMLPFDAKRMNAAQDYVINSILIDSKIGKMPKEGLYDPQYTSDMLADVVYTKLPPSEEREGGGGHGGFDQHLPKPGPGTTPAEDANRKSAIAAAAALAKQMGNLPAGLARVIQDIIEPKKNWKELVWDMLLMHTGTDEYTWAKPRRRSLALPPHIPMPGRTGFSIGCLSVHIDASGSIGPQEQSLFVGCLSEFVTQFTPREMHVIWWDTEAFHEEIDLDGGELDLTQLHPVGGGGTSYGCVPRLLEDLGIEPDVAICLTDGYVDWPNESEIRWPHITVSTGKEAPFGRNVIMEIP